MANYSYLEPSVIDEVVFRESARGAFRAYLHAREGTSLAMFQEITQKLVSKGWQCIPFMQDGKPVLEVRGFKRDTDFIALLGKEKWVEGKPAITLQKEDKITWLDKLRKRTLQLTGATYVVGDWGFWDYGRTGGDKLVMAASVSYFLGTLSLLFYGRNDQSDIQVHEFAKDMERFLAEHKVKPSEDSALHKITEHKDKSFLQSAHEFLKHYPSEAFNTVTALAGVFVAASAYKKINSASALKLDAKAIAEIRKVGWMDFGLGTLTTASGIFGTVVKEKKHDPDEPPARGFQWLREKIHEHPLAVTGIGYMISTVFHAGSTWKDYHEAKRINDPVRLKSVPMRGLFVGMAFLSEFLLAISSKGHGQGVQSDTSVSKSVIALGADTIALQPKAVQDKLIDSLGMFMSSPEVLAMKDSEVNALLRKEVEAMRTNPWVQAMTTKKEMPEKPAPISAAKRETSGWQAKIASAEPSLSGLSA